MPTDQAESLRSLARSSRRNAIPVAAGWYWLKTSHAGCWQVVEIMNAIHDETRIKCLVVFFAGSSVRRPLGQYLIEYAEAEWSCPLDRFN